MGFGRTPPSFVHLKDWCNLAVGCFPTSLMNRPNGTRTGSMASSSLYCSSSSADFPAFLHNEREQLARTQPVQVGVVKPPGDGEETTRRRCERPKTWPTRTKPTRLEGDIDVNFSLLEEGYWKRFPICPCNSWIPAFQFVCSCSVCIVNSNVTIDPQSDRSSDPVKDFSGQTGKWLPSTSFDLMNCSKSFVRPTVGAARVVALHPSDSPYPLPSGHLGTTHLKDSRDPSIFSSSQKVCGSLGYILREGISPPLSYIFLFSSLP